MKTILTTEINLNNHPEICNFCHVGRIIERKLAYTERFQDELILIPNIPAKVCDYCGDRQYDPQAMSSLHRLLWADLKTSEEKHSKVRAYIFRIDAQTRFNKGQFSPDEE